METARREALETSCRRMLTVTTYCIDVLHHDAYNAYIHIKSNFNGMARAFLAIREYDLLDIANHYYNIADHRATKAFSEKYGK